MTMSKQCCTRLVKFCVLKKNYTYIKHFLGNKTIRQKTMRLLFSFFVFDVWLLYIYSYLFIQITFLIMTFNDQRKNIDPNPCFNGRQCKASYIIFLFIPIDKDYLQWWRLNYFAFNLPCLPRVLCKLYVFLLKTFLGSFMKWFVVDK